MDDTYSLHEMRAFDPFEVGALHPHNSSIRMSVEVVTEWGGTQ